MERANIIQNACPQQTTIAVIIPVFNCEKYLRSAVDSVLSQPYQEISIVLVDDGSTDKSGQICDELATKNSRITTLHQKNAGVSAARNAGIEFVLSEACCSSYIAFLDADDGWDSDFFDENTVRLLHQNYDLIGFQYCNCDANLRPYDLPCEMKSGLYSGGQRSVWLHAKQCFASMLYSCKLLQKYEARFFEGLNYSEDKIFSMQCMYLADTVCLENRLMYLYRHIGISAMSRRQYGIPYYVPIIDGYIRLDSLMSRFSDIREPLSESRLMASIYIMDMVDEHYNIMRSKKEMDKLLLSRPDYISIVEATGKYADLKPSLSYAQYKAHPRHYIIKERLIGVKRICRKIYKTICSRLLQIQK